MASLRVDLPEPLKSQAESRAARAGFDNLEEYVRSLVELDAGGSALQEHLLSRLRSGPPSPMTAGDFARIRERLDDEILCRIP